MSRYDDRVSLVEMLNHAGEAVVNNDLSPPIWPLKASVGEQA